MESSMIKRPDVIFFDIMDTVVVDPFFAHDFAGLIGCPREELFERMTPDLWPTFERGEIEADEYYRRFFRDGRGVDGAQLEAWMADRYCLIEGMEALLTELKELDIELYALSNYPVWWQLIEARLQLSQWIKWGFVSCEMGVRKPDPQAYLIPSKAVGAAPGSCLFIDDRQSNCDGARSVGMDAVCFESAAALRRELVARHVAIKAPL
ncbi:MAG TPA: hypothetical protein DCQ06_12670 [Myxococcales bacterium]|nr:hypothetical protein [Myxococcales bacterium]